MSNGSGYHYVLVWVLVDCLSVVRGNVVGPSGICRFGSSSLTASQHDKRRLGLYKVSEVNVRLLAVSYYADYTGKWGLPGYMCKNQLVEPAGSSTVLRVQLQLGCYKWFPMLGHGTICRLSGFQYFLRGGSHLVCALTSLHRFCPLSLRASCSALAIPCQRSEEVRGLSMPIKRVQQGTEASPRTPGTRHPGLLKPT